MHSDVFATVDRQQIDIIRNGLRIMALRALGDVDAADDVAQEALLRALSSVTPEIAMDSVRLGAFVGGIARHVIADVRRARARAQSRHADLQIVGAAEEDALSRLIGSQDRQRVRSALERLTAADQMILRASFFEGLTPSEIAERLDQPPERVRKRKSRALSRLRGIFERTEGHESVSLPSMTGEIAYARGGE